MPRLRGGSDARSRSRWARREDGGEELRLRVEVQAQEFWETGEGEGEEHEISAEEWYSGRVVFVVLARQERMLKGESIEISKWRRLEGSAGSVLDRRITIWEMLDGK